MDLLPFESDDEPMNNNSASYSLGELTGTIIVIFIRIEPEHKFIKIRIHIKTNKKAFFRNRNLITTDNFCRRWISIFKICARVHLELHFFDITFE